MSAIGRKRPTEEELENARKLLALDEELRKEEEEKKKIDSGEELARKLGGKLVTTSYNKLILIHIALGEDLQLIFAEPRGVLAEFQTSPIWYLLSESRLKDLSTAVEPIFPLEALVYASNYVRIGLRWNFTNDVMDHLISNQSWFSNEQLSLLEAKRIERKSITKIIYRDVEDK